MNKINKWSYDKPTATGLYLICYGDIAVSQNVEPLSIINREPCGTIASFYPWPMASVETVSKWGSGWKFARLEFGVKNEQDY